MSVIRAFVGHSFTEDDKILNRTFLDYLDQIKEMDIGFNWDRAMAAEPRELAQKVMRLIQDKNLFIGICTKKELVIEQNNLKRCLTKRKVLKSHESNFLWKTSDWIIQEIGLAVSREMDLILLIEEELRQPGGLQGNIEYIPFNRQYPERSFGRILEMIRALIPKAVKTSIQELSTTSPESAAQEQDKKETGSEWYDPKPEWDYAEYKFAFLYSIIKDNHEAEKKITTAFLQSPKACGPNGPAIWEAYGQYIRLEYGKDGTLSKIEQLAKENPEVDQVQSFLGKAYEIYKENGKGAQAYKRAAEQAAGAEDRLYYLGEAAKAYCRGAMKLEYEEVTTRMRQEVVESGVGEETLVITLREIADIESDMDVYYGLSERLLELNSGDDNIRFKLAYKYSQGKEDKLTLFHYLRIPSPGRESGTWNNLGVQYDHFKIVASSVSAYRKAEQAGETLAMSNIANKLIDAGFLSEADDICSKALKTKDYHKNVSRAIARIKEIPEEEKKREEEIVKEAALYSDFYKAYGRGLYKSDLSGYIGLWEGPTCHLTLKIQGRHFLAEGTYDLPKKQPLATGFYSVFGAKAPPATSEKRIVKYVGTLSGHSIKAMMTEEGDNNEAASNTNTLLGSLLSRNGRTVVMVISDSFNEIRVYDKDASESQKLYTLRKLSDGE